MDRCQTTVHRRWNCKYFVKSRHESLNKNELEDWLETNRDSVANKKRCHVLKRIDSRTGETEVLCKVRGEFFVVKGLTALQIVYVNSLKVFLTDMVKRKKEQ